MTGTIGRVVMTLAVLAIGTSPAAAQRLNSGEASVGTVAATVVRAGGLYLDAGMTLWPMTSVVGEVQAFGPNLRELVALGGVRQRLILGSRGDVYAQALVGGATGYSSRCDLCSAGVVELGLGANIAVRSRWAVRVRGDIRSGGSAGDPFYPTLGAGVTRVW